MEDVDKALQEADTLMNAAERNNDIPLAAEQQRSAIYALLRQLLLEVSDIKEAIKDRAA